MGYIKTGTANARTATAASRIVETDAATLDFVRLILKQVRTLEHEAANARPTESGGVEFYEAAKASRRFIGRIVEAASDGVRTQLNEEGTWIMLFFLLILRGPIFADTLPERSDLFATLRAFHVETAQAALVEFDVADRRAWTHLLPSIGITLGQPTIGFSLGQWLNFREQKAIRKAKKAFILRGPILNFRSDSFALVALLRQYENLTTGFSYLMKVEAVENQRFELIKEKWKDGTLAPLAWLDAQSANLASGEPLRARREALEQLEIDIRKLAKY